MPTPPNPSPPSAIVVARCACRAHELAAAYGKCPHCGEPIVTETMVSIEEVVHLEIEAVRARRTTAEALEAQAAVATKALQLQQRLEGLEPTLNRLLKAGEVDPDSIAYVNALHDISRLLGAIDRHKVAGGAFSRPYDVHLYALAAQIDNPTEEEPDVDHHDHPH